MPDIQQSLLDEDEPGPSSAEDLDESAQTAPLRPITRVSNTSRPPRAFRRSQTLEGSGRAAARAAPASSNVYTPPTTMTSIYEDWDPVLERKLEKFGSALTRRHSGQSKKFDVNTASSNLMRVDTFQDNDLLCDQVLEEISEGAEYEDEQSPRPEGASPVSPKSTNQPEFARVMLMRNNVDRIEAPLEAQERSLFRTKHIIQIAFSLACALLALVTWFLVRTNRLPPGGPFYIPMSTWFLLTATIFPTIKICSIAMDAVVRLLEVSLERVDNIHYLLIGTSKALRLLASVVCMLLVVEILIQEETKAEKTLKRMRQTALCAVVFSIVEVIKKIGCRLLSLRVLAQNIFTRLREAIYKEQLLHRLLHRSQATDADRHNTERYSAISRALSKAGKTMPTWQVGFYLNKLRQSSLSMNSKGLSLTDQMARLIRQFENMTEAQVDEHACRAAEYFWWICRDDVESFKLTKDDLENMLGGEALSEYAFQLFDTDKDGWVMFAEVQHRFKRIYRERRNIATTLLDTREVLRTLETLVGCVLHGIAFFIYLFIFNNDVGQILISLSSVAIAGAFVFGNSLRTVYESIVFLFIIHPYQVGDRILYNGIKHTVNNFGVMATQFYRFDGSKVWVPNEKLMATEIVNITQSKVFQERFTFEVDSRKVSLTMIDDLSARIQDLVNSSAESHRFDKTYDAYAHIMGVKDPLKYEVGICYQMAFNIESFERVCAARTRVNLVIGKWQRDHKLQHTESLQPAFYKLKPDSQGGSVASSGYGSGQLNIQADDPYQPRISTNIPSVFENSDDGDSTQDIVPVF